MRISSNSVPPKISTPANPSNRASGQGKILGSEQTKESTAPHSTLISRQELKELASELKSGRINKDEAVHRFVDTVVAKSIQEKLGEKDRAQLVHDINVFFAQDVEFVKKLEKNLSDLA